MLAWHRLAPIVVIMMTLGDRNEAVNAFVHVSGEPIDVVDATVVSQVKLLGPQTQNSIHGLVCLDRLEMWRRRCRINELAVLCVEFAIGDTETVTREHAS